MHLSVLLSAPVPAGSAVSVSLASSAPALASLPSDVVIGAGQTNAFVSVNRVDVTADTPIDLSASLYGATRIANLVLEPLKVRSVTSSGGANPWDACTYRDFVVMLNEFAPPGGVEVDVAIDGGRSETGTFVSGSSPPTWKVPIPAGSSGTSIRVLADWSGIPRSISIVASLGPSSASTSSSVSAGVMSFWVSPETTERGGSLDARISFSGSYGCRVLWNLDVSIASSAPSVLSFPTPIRFVSSAYSWDNLPIQWKAALPVPTSAGSGSTNLTATFEDASGSAVVTVRPAALTAFVVGPTEAPPGVLATGSVTIDSLAPPKAQWSRWSALIPRGSRHHPPSRYRPERRRFRSRFPCPALRRQGVELSASYLGITRSVTVKVLSADAARISGSVFDDSRWDYEVAVEGARILAAGSEVLTTVDSSGRFVVYAEPGSLDLSVQAAGFVSLALGPLTLVPREERELGRTGLDRLMTGSCPVNGRIVAESGDPIAGARLKLLGYDVDVTTGADGRFAFVGPFFKRYRALVEKPGLPRLLHDLHGEPGYFGTCAAYNPLPLLDVTLPASSLPEMSAFWADPPELEPGQQAVLKGWLSGEVPSYDTDGSLSRADSTYNDAYYNTSGTIAAFLPVGGRDFDLTSAFGWDFRYVGTPVSARESRNYTFFYGGTFRRASVTFLPSGEQAFYVACSPPVVQSGGYRSCRLSIGSRTAPAGGLEAALQSSDSRLTVPSVVTVPQGSTWTTFGISASPVSVRTPVTLTASEGARTTSLALTVEPGRLESVRATPARLVSGGTSREKPPCPRRQPKEASRSCSRCRGPT